MADFDIDAALRWFRFEKHAQLRRRPDGELPFMAATPSVGQALLLDTCVVIDALYDRLPAPVAKLLALRHVNHSACVVQELMHSIGALDPRDGRTPAVVAQIAAVIRAMPAHRIFAPDVETMGRAALLSGLLCRIQNFGGDHRKRALSDATLFLQAHKLGLVVVTRNVVDFDLLLQLFPRVGVCLYRV